MSQLIESPQTRPFSGRLAGGGLKSWEWQLVCGRPLGFSVRRGGNVIVDFVAATQSVGLREKAPMTQNQPAKELHELKRRRETPLPLIEMFDELLSLAPGLSAKQKRKRSDEIMATALKRLERKDASSQPEASGRASALISPLAETTVPEWPQRLVCARCGSRTVGMAVTGTERR
jgi:hypothetical protein